MPRLPSLKYVDQIIHREFGHLKPGCATRAAYVRRDYDVGQLEQRIVALG
jgi:hypothetical protein